MKVFRPSIAQAKVQFIAGAGFSVAGEIQNKRVVNRSYVATDHLIEITGATRILNDLTALG
jgi:hypothetical protein